MTSERMSFNAQSGSKIPFQFGGLVFFLFIIYLLTFVFEGVLRYTLSNLGLSSFLYLRDLIPISMVAYLFFVWIVGRAQPTVLILFLYILTLHFLVGFYYMEGVFQQLIGLKVFFPFLLGMSIGLYLCVNKSSVKILVITIVLISAVGVVINYFYVYPWEGLEYDTMFGITTQSRLWWSGGERRLSGLSRASFSAATVLLIGSTLILFLFKSFWVKYSVFLFAFAAIYLTTSKGGMMAMLLVLIAYLVSNKLENTKIIKLMLSVVLILVIFAPIVSYLIELKSLPTNIPDALTSFFVRIVFMWPQAFDLWFSSGNILLGRGPGGIGVSMRYGDSNLFNAADNIFVYWSVTFGLLGWVVMFLFISKIFTSEDKYYVQKLFILLSILAYGMTLNVFEDAVLAISIGVVVGLTYRNYVYN